MATISCCVIAKNEEKNIERMTKSIEGLFDEYILVDTGSSDKTVELAKKLGWQVHHFEWISDFAAARNFAFSKATKDFTFWMDLDDVLANPEGFKSWKEVVMPLYDYHAANYFYAFDGQNRPVCTFVRERVFRREKGFKWKYPIHEGVTPECAGGQASMSFTTAWRIDHLRDAKDLEQDRSRNLGIFSVIRERGQMDARMQYYYGKELFENGRAAEAIPELQKALLFKDLEIHDRIIGTQYLCFAHLSMGDQMKDGSSEKARQYGECISHASNGTMLMPLRAEFYVVMADALLKSGRGFEALPLYHAAKNCPMPDPTKAPSPIFHNADAYTYYPTIQIARLYAMAQDFEKAQKYAREAFDMADTKEVRQMLAELDSITTQSNGYKLAKPCDDIVITTPPQHAYPFDPDVAKNKSMGGSETALMEMAKWLHKKSGRKVKVFMMRQDNKVCDGVEYLTNAMIPQYMTANKPWIHIAWRHNIKITDAPTFLWSHDLVTPGVELSDNFVKVLCLTPWHAKYLSATQGTSSDKIHITRNGVIEERFKEPVDHSKKDPNLFVFGSSPDRGLDNAILVLDKVREKHPNVKLRIHYGWDHWGDCQGRPDLLATRDKLKQMVADRPWIDYRGATQQDELMKSYRESSYNIQPSAWIETSCLSALELVLCGVYPIFRKVGGVSDTLAPFVESGHASLLEEDFSKPEHVDVYAKEVLRVMDKKRADGQFSNELIHSLSWEKVAEEWLDALPKLAYN